ncbi:Pre-rRNA-processing protein TSR2-domain-containing protein [Xylariaceae sp. FL1019]|nr:Pre-rRNA-processing protein TSR2-domain-containing protein [Xylariaceae sp. FL1019]
MTSTSSDGPSPETRQAEFEQGIVMSLHLWTSLTIAVQNQWGGPDSSDKRDWLAGAISDMFPSFPDLHKLTTASQSTTTTTTSKSKTQKLPEEPIPEDIEETLLQVLGDEFETNVDDGSEQEVADRIMRCRAQCAEGNFTLVSDLRKRWEESRGKKVVLRETEAPDQETDDSGSDDEDDEEENDDVEMGDAPQLVGAGARRPKPEKIIDEDGFETVVRKR